MIRYPVLGLGTQTALASEFQNSFFLSMKAFTIPKLPLVFGPVS